MTKHVFPLVADGQPIIELARQMNLYENEDLITNIHGYYQDKHYDDMAHDNPSSATLPYNDPSSRLSTIDEGRNYAQEAKKRARKDLKEKRQSYIAKEMTHNTKSSFHKIGRDNPKELSKQAIKSDNKWNRLSKNLSQDSYILAEIPKQYKEPKQAKTDSTSKNNYDFLKRSQIYNNQEARLQKEKSIAQELNLTRFDELS
ncbi:hypothetical protein N1495_07660 [Streptococcus didelphis]|uniref:hypothetical protein n=1 Tax=Streptococcus didelphis TaxID=102886 RepID=UPI00036DD6D0|nr:hypothetical protein [Streptococcus didelphis]WMB29246.1 hypothetical protein N1495_07660 [Streptococcus didelphis]